MTFDLLQAAGLRNLVWRTPGADGGRDIEGTFTSIDFSKYYQHQKWYVECKRYSNSIDWPTVWNKIAYADSRGADFLLLVTNSNPSPSCENEILAWNSNNRSPLVRVWRGYELEGVLKNYPHVAAKYGLLGKTTDAELSLQTLMFEATKLAQASYVSHELGVANTSAMEAGAALAELVSARYSQIRTYGRIIIPVNVTTAPNYEWLSWSGSLAGWDDIGIRALLTMVRHLTGSKSIKADSTGKHLTLLLTDARFVIAGTGDRTFGELATWADVEIEEVSKNLVKISRRG
ncbi:restriction endonuclease [Rhizobium laguerreae]|nr:restriction endonuclease [Rhizobium laguerreae]MBY3355159.1 restriction endonuclease [Rhizobium laguerreae]MBY3372852.1 restriction endonuclease [Rhizobium laguerreae]MBY3428019.1 restriction endonuclease [Rhizobium laguerreae]MBY3437029.1 restriction endonuclease [Rhizobium laguerreae]